MPSEGGGPSAGTGPWCATTNESWVFR